MSMNNATETALLKLIGQNVAFTGIGDAGGLLPSAAAGNIYIALYTADPGESGSATTNEATYTGYARVAIARNSGAIDVTGNVMSNLAAVNFALCTGGTNTITHFAFVSSASGAASFMLSGALLASLAVSNGITPNFAIAQLTATAD